MIIGAAVDLRSGCFAVQASVRAKRGSYDVYYSGVHPPLAHMQLE